VHLVPLGGVVEIDPDPAGRAEVRKIVVIEHLRMTHTTDSIESSISVTGHSARVLGSRTVAATFMPAPRDHR
jgi:hypothetical protein